MHLLQLLKNTLKQPYRHASITIIKNTLKQLYRHASITIIKKYPKTAIQACIY